MEKLIRTILLTVLASLFTSPVSFSDQNVRIEVKDVETTDDKWHSSWKSNPLQFKHFEAIVCDSTGKQYAIVASVAGNRYMYEAHAWLATTDEWYEIYRMTKAKMKSKGPDVWTKDERLSYAGNMSAGWRIKAEGDEAAFEVVSTPQRPVSQCSVTGSSADFNGHISFRTKVDGKIVMDHQNIDVSGFGYCIHTFGNMGGDHTAWTYIGFKDEKLCITAMNAQFDTDRLNLFVTVDGDMKMDQYEPDRVSWKELDQNTWRISATSKGGRQIDMAIRLIKPRPTNKDQPYAKYSLGPIGFSKTILYEYLAEVQATVTAPDLGGQMELRSLGIATKFDLTR